MKKDENYNIRFIEYLSAVKEQLPQLLIPGLKTRVYKRVCWTRSTKALLNQTRNTWDNGDLFIFGNSFFSSLNLIQQHEVQSVPLRRNPTLHSSEIPTAENRDREQEREKKEEKLYSALCHRQPSTHSKCSQSQLNPGM